MRINMEQLLVLKVAILSIFVVHLIAQSNDCEYLYFYDGKFYIHQGKDPTSEPFLG